MKPHSLFELWRADEVAECLEGVSDELYQKLWNDIVPLQGKVIANDGSWNLAKYWDKLTAEEQATLNTLAEAQDKKYWGD